MLVTDSLVMRIILLELKVARQDSLHAVGVVTLWGVKSKV